MPDKNVTITATYKQEDKDDPGDDQKMIRMMRRTIRRTFPKLVIPVLHGMVIAGRYIGGEHELTDIDEKAQKYSV